MVDKGIGDYFISDTDDESFEDDDLLGAPVVVPVTPQIAPAPVAVAPSAPVAPVAAPVAPAPVVASPAVTSAPQATYAPARPQAAARQLSREEALAQALDELMHEDADIQAAALVSLDGFTMASALPAGMQADRIGAMSAAILGLGERAAAELGRGHL
ncbi:MAG: roadblock/LC7 domain-containing protein, partial [Coriobacteriia bacterium]